MKMTLTLVAALMLGGCASFGKGVAEAFLERQGSEDTRVCQVRGKPFGGIEPGLSNRHGKMKVLMVHGVGHHIPGYSTQFLEKLSQETGLTVEARQHREITLTDPGTGKKNLGTLRVTRLLNPDGDREMLFYELTWSPITEPDKKILAYDNSGEYSFRRAAVNDMLKKFSNDTGPDPMIYLGDEREDILTAFRQSFCWMVTADWEGLPSNGQQRCNPVSEAAVDHLSADRIAIVSHSLGSRITIDGMQSLAQTIGKRTASDQRSSVESRFIDTFREKEMPLYMLSNQLPLLQLGRALPEVAGQKKAYCTPGQEHYNERTLSKTALIAFSDPNDLLSYAIPEGFAEQYLDSRLCVEVTNININVADVMDLFGVGKVANPLTAHVGYDSDDRVVALIAKGIGTPNTAPLVKERCQWTRLVD